VLSSFGSVVTARLTANPVLFNELIIILLSVYLHIMTAQHLVNTAIIKVTIRPPQWHEDEAERSRVRNNNFVRILMRPSQYRLLGGTKQDVACYPTLSQAPACGTDLLNLVTTPAYF
jgi:hypothetical protein